MAGAQKPSFGSPARSHSAPSSVSNFAKALFEAGGNQAGQSHTDAPSGLAGEALSSMFGNAGGNWPVGGPSNFPGSQDPQSGFNPWENPFGQNEFLKSQEQIEAEQKRRERRLLRHREIQQIGIYDAHQVERDRKIKQILEELEKLSKDLSSAFEEAKEAQKSVITGVPSAGEYHISFLEKLMKVIVLLRKRVKESQTWLSTFNSRKGKQKGYWASFYQHGTQWGMSGERSIATSVG